MSSELERRINAEIGASGPISFARFMERALTEPEIGYYVTSRVRAGGEGDFITAPEMHTLIGSAVARVAVATWDRLGRPAPFRWVEYGAGSGAMLLSAVAQLARDASPLLSVLEVQTVEINVLRSAELFTAIENIPAAQRPKLVDANAPAVAGILIANEYLDALPFHIYVGRCTTPYGTAERCVGLTAEGERTWTERPLSAEEARRVGERFGGPLAEGQLAEACFLLDDWTDELARRISHGLVLVIDYGREGAKLRDAATRMAGTALAYQDHKATSDLLSEPGARDLTAHVDLTALRVAARAAGLSSIASTTQAAFLAQVGLDEEVARARRGSEATLEGAIALRSALARLMNPRGMGGFAVELFALGTPEQVALLTDSANPLPGTAAPIRPLV